MKNKENTVYLKDKKKTKAKKKRTQKPNEFSFRSRVLQYTRVMLSVHVLERISAHVMSTRRAPNEKVKLLLLWGCAVTAKMGPHERISAMEMEKTMLLRQNN